MSTWLYNMFSCYKYLDSASILEYAYAGCAELSTIMYLSGSYGALTSNRASLPPKKICRSWSGGPKRSARVVPRVVPRGAVYHTRVLLKDAT